MQAKQPAAKAKPSDYKKLFVTTMKITNTIFATPKFLKKTFKAPNWPFIAWKSWNMESRTSGKTLEAYTGTEQPNMTKIRPWPTTLVTSTPKA